MVSRLELNCFSRLFLLIAVLIVFLLLTYLNTLNTKELRFSRSKLLLLLKSKLLLLLFKNTKTINSLSPLLSSVSSESQLMSTLWPFSPPYPLRGSSSLKLGRHLHITCSAVRALRVAMHWRWRPTSPKRPQWSESPQSSTYITNQPVQPMRVCGLRLHVVCHLELNM